MENTTKEVLLVRCQDYSAKEVHRALTTILEYFEIKEKWEKNKVLLLKPNLCLSVSPEKNITTHPEIIRQLIAILREQYSLEIGESPIGNLDKISMEELKRITGIKKVIDEYGVVYTNLSEKVKKHYLDDELKMWIPISENICDSILINVPKLKTHSYTLLSGCIKNLYGVLPGNSKKYFHKVYPELTEFSDLLVKIYDFCNPRLNIVDAVGYLEGNGPGIKGTPKKMGLLIAGIDGQAVDKVLCRLMGLEEKVVPTISLGNEEDIYIAGEDIENYVQKANLPDSYKELNKVKLISKKLQLNKGKVKINEDFCKKCQKCIMQCPQKAISNINKKIIINQKKCVQCFVCAEQCMYGAIDIEDTSLVAEIMKRRKQQ